MMSDTNNSEITFEDLMGQLENCVEQLEKGGISLEGAAGIYEKGMTLAAEASKRLSEADLKITSIQEKYEQAIEGGLETEGLDVKEL
ncbi:MAG: exodeoxyribonuclease VII small subunit [Chloroflexota bacterium]|nr:exodeoxyribonuclease VII small subunit [Chloroflexota bacterium]